MVSLGVLLSITALAVVGCLTNLVEAHGYMYIPLAEFEGSASSAWIVEIEPQFDADWASISDYTKLIELYVEKAKEAGYANNIRKLLDSDTSLYGADCGFTNPKADPKDPPTDGTATLSQGVGHHGPCEIWLDDTMVLHNDDCEKAFGTSNYETIKSVFTPVDYSSCSTSGCMLRFYWLAFRSVDAKYVWQIYKDCVPLSGPAEGQTSTATTSSASASSNATQMTTDAPATETPMTTASATETTATEAPEGTEATVTATEAPAPTTPSTTKKCNARDVKRSAKVSSALTSPL